ncbi:MAG TPA: DUF4149 domain-containing protein [Gammaproteobacteria bacterium]|nr:DUF4149 domain-containing protein [Gammaproteobacteria bacterium]
MKKNIQIQLEKILLTLWVGGMWFAGYVVVPILFQSLDRKMAGMVAGQVFTVTAYIGLISGLALFASLVFIRPAGKFGHPRHWVLLGMIALILTGQLVLQPMMSALKQTGLVEGSQAVAEFGHLHGISSILYLVNSLLGLGLVIFGLRSPVQGS